MPTAIIIGATGLVGKSLLTLCTNDNFFKKIIIITRKPSQVSNPKIEEIICPDFSKLNTLEFSIKDSLYAFCCLGTTKKKAGSRNAFKLVDLDYVLDFANICQRLQAKHFSVISAIGASPYSLSFYSRIKGQMEKCVSKIPLPSISIMRPSLLLGIRNEKRFAEDIGQKLPLSFLGPWRPIKAIDVAKAMLYLAKKETPNIQVFPSGKIRSLSNDH